MFPLSAESLVDKSCLSIASNNYAEALELLTKANEKSSSPCPVIINNMSVCLLYLGRLKEALNLLETNLTSNPEAFLQETQVLNLATLYELESSYAGQKKQSLDVFTTIQNHKDICCMYTAAVLAYPSLRNVIIY